MLLTVREVARLLETGEEDVYRWVESGKIPCERVNDQPRFDRTDLLEWAMSRRRAVSVDMFGNDEGGKGHGLAEALRVGGVHAGVRGADRQAVLSEVLARMPVPDEADRQLLLGMLLAREALGSTAAGGGIAIPHVRSPAVIPGSRPSITLCFLDQPLELAAPDGQPVHTLFTLLSTTIRGHLQLLAKLASALHDEAFKRAVQSHAEVDEILQHAARIDAGFAHARGASRTAAS